MKEGNGRVTAADYQKVTKILVTGFETGIFLIYEMPQFVLISSLRLVVSVLALCSHQFPKHDAT